MTEWPPKDFAKRARDGTWTHESTIDAAQDEIEFLHARITRLHSALATARREALEALKPFADFPFPVGVDSNDLNAVAVMNSQGRLTVGDFHRAAAAYLTIRALLSQSVEVGRAEPRGEDDEEGLRPCPFCGGEAERIDFEDERDKNDNFGGSCIACKRCSASTAVHFDRKENLESSWNERTSPIHRDEVAAPQLLAQSGKEP